MLGFIGGVMPVAVLPALPGWLLTLAVSLAGVYLSVHRSRMGQLAGGACLGAVLAIVFGHSLLERRLVQDCEGIAVRVKGTVVSLPVTRKINTDTLRQRFEFDVQHMEPAHCAAPRTLLLSYFGDEAVIPGQTWRFAARLHRPWGLANPGSMNMQAWFVQTGIDAVGAVRRGYLLAPASMASVPHHQLRYRISRGIDRLELRADVAAVLKALAVADRSGIDGSLWRLFQLYGVNHLLVISGLHIGMVAGLGYLLGGAVARVSGIGAASMYWRVAGGCLLAAGYAALAGFTLPTQRALFMLLALMLAVVAGRRGSSVNSLLLAAVLVLAANPLAVLGAGFWLSFGAVAMLLWIGTWAEHASKLVQALSMHTLMALLMLPLGAWFFSGGSLVSALANLLLIPLVGMVIVPVTLVAATASALDLPSVAGLLWSALAQGLGPLLDIARVLQGAHGDHLFLELGSTLAELLLGVLAVVLLVVPLNWRLRTVALTLLLPLFLPPLVAPSQEEGHAGEQGLGNHDPASLSVVVLDVGQGTSVVLQSGRQVLLYDTGGGDPAGAHLATGVVIPYLRSRGVAALDTFVISHADLDHSAGAHTVASTYPVSRLRYGDAISGIAGGRHCRAGEAWQWPGGIHFQFLSPLPNTQAGRNDRSCVLQVSVGDTRLLLPGDIGAAVERDLVRYWAGELASHWLLVPHHGSRSSSSWPLLKWTRPSDAAISSGYGNRFGHPHQAVVSRYLALAVGLDNTAHGGALSFTVDAGGIGPVHSYREKYHRYWM